MAKRPNQAEHLEAKAASYRTEAAQLSAAPSAEAP